MRIEHRALRLTLFGRPNIALSALQPTPGARRRYADRKACRRLSRRHPVLHRPNDPLSQIHTVRLAHRCLRPLSRNRITLPFSWESPRLAFQGKRSSFTGSVKARPTRSSSHRSQKASRMLLIPRSTFARRALYGHVLVASERLGLAEVW